LQPSRLGRKRCIHGDRNGGLSPRNFGNPHDNDASTGKLYQAGSRDAPVQTLPSSS
jgi:hypothetical protein